MNTRVRTTLQTMKTPMKHEKAAKSRFGGDKKEKGEKQGKGLIDVEKPSKWRSSSKERKMALQQDVDETLFCHRVDKLKKKLRHEENLHRALERAFTRPLGALPRLPPYLPPNTLELLAEVAVLEEEVVRLEEQVVNFRQGLYEEAIHISASKKNIESEVDLHDPCQNLKPDQSKSSSCVMGLETFTERSLPFYPDDPSGSNLLHSNLPTDPTAHSSNRPMNRKQTSKRFLTPSAFTGDGQGKENQSNANFAKDKQIPLKKTTRSPASVRTHVEPRSTGKYLEPRKLQPESRVDQERAEDSTTSIPSGLESAGDNPNKISEDILRCLLGIFLRMSKPKATTMESEILTSISSSSSSCESLEEIEFLDPYEICTEIGKRDDIGPYKYLHVFAASSIICDQVKNSPFLMQRLKILFGKLALVDLRGLSHQQKLAFWINIYNSCMMNAYLEHGVPRSPEMVIVLMRKAMINVSGHLLNAMTIEHFILRLPYSKFTPKGVKIDEATMRNMSGLDWPEPLVTFALSCGSWSSPAVRVYTAGNVENELEKAKRDYLQAAVGISETKVAIPKLLDWYLLDFAKDLDSLLDWISVQIPGGVRKEAMKEANLCSVQVLPYEFSFRYLF